jgi:hypothetical protein
MSELASIVLSVAGDRSGLPILADFLEEKLGLGHTAALFRLPDLGPPPKGTHQHSQFCWYPLAADVSISFAAGRHSHGKTSARSRPHTIVCLYAHPPGDARRWARISSALVGEDQPPPPEKPWDHSTAKPDPRIETAKEEVARVKVAPPA